jgi:hypothetical protein
MYARHPDGLLKIIFIIFSLHVCFDAGNHCHHFRVVCGKYGSVNIISEH